MKHLSIAFFSLALGLGLGPAASAVPCVTCTAKILPGMSAVKLPLEDWTFELVNQPVEILESPKFGTWDPMKQSYSPGPDFAKVGIDRMQFQQINDPVPRTIVLVASQMKEESVITTFPTPKVFGGAAESGVASITILPSEGAPGVGGVTLTSVNPPAVQQPEVQPILQLEGLAHVELVSTATSLNLVASADHPGLLCGTSCRTTMVPIQAATTYTISVTLGYSVLEVPTNDYYTLRLKVCGRDGQCMEVELANLQPIDLSGSLTLNAGLVGGASGNTSVSVGSIKLWRLVPTAEDLAGKSSYEGFATSPIAGYLNPVGAGVNWTLMQGEANLQGMSFASVRQFQDERPNDIRRLRAIFDLDLSQLSLSESDSLVPFWGQLDTPFQSTGTKSFDLFVRKLNGSYFLRGRLLRDDGTNLVTTVLPLAAGPNTITLHWYAPSPDDMAGGPGFLKVRANHNYAEVSLSTGVNNLNRSIDRINIGISQPTLQPLAVTPEDRRLHFDNLTTYFVQP